MNSRRRIHPSRTGSRLAYSTRRVAAGASGFLTLIQSGERPERYGLYAPLGDIRMSSRYAGLADRNAPWDLLSRPWRAGAKGQREAPLAGLRLPWRNGGLECSRPAPRDQMPAAEKASSAEREDEAELAVHVFA